MANRQNFTDALALPLSIRPARLILLAFAFALAMGGVMTASTAAQDDTSRREPEGLTTARIQDQIDLGLAELKAAKDLDDERRTRIENIYQKATQDLTLTQTLAESENRFRQQAQEAPEDITNAQKELDQSSGSLERSDLPDSASAEQIETQLRNIAAKLSTAREKQRELAAEPARRQQRLDKLPDEVAANDAALEDAQQRSKIPAIAGDPETLSNARAIYAKTSVDMLAQKGATLRAEQQAYLATAELLPIQIDLENRKVKQLTERTEKLQRRLDSVRQKEITNLAEETRDQAKRTFEELQPFAERNVELIEQLDNVIGQVKVASKMAAAATAANEKLQKDLEVTKTRVGDQDAKLSEAMGVMLRQEKADLVLARNQLQQTDTLQDTVNIRVQRYQTEDELDEVADPAAAAEMILDNWATLQPDNMDAPRRKILREPLTKLLSKRKEMLTRLKGLQNDLIGKLTELETAQRSYANTSEEYTTLIDEHILWIRSAPAIGAGDPTAWPAATQWLTRPDHWMSASRAMVNALVNRLPRALPWVIFAVTMVLLHPVLSKKIYEAGLEAEKRQCRDFTPTGRTFVRTVIKSIMWPLLMYVAGELIKLGVQSEGGSGSGFAMSLGVALTQTAILLLPIEFLRQVFRGKGLAESHSEWNATGSKRLKRDLDRFIPIAAVLMTTMLTLRHHGVDDWKNTLGRALLVALLGGTSIVMYRVMRPGGVFFERDIKAEKSNAWFMQLGYFRLVFLTGIPIVLMIFALAGYNYMASELGKVWNETLAVAIGLLALYMFAMRFLLVRRRRLRYDQLIEQREQQRKAAEEANEETMLANMPIELKTESGLDITDVSRQAKEMTGVLFGVVAVFIFWNLWQDLLPATKIFDSWQLWQAETGENGEAVDWVTFRDLTVALLLFGLTILGVRNIPGMLELLLLKQLPLDSGSRYAISTIVRYIITVAGIVLALSFLKISWTKYSWLVAAISVGLGFGLQEIVANFVSGLILLLERPVRVGDVVTVDGTTGIVSRIQMRATTVTNWDNQELVVPNKDLITGKLMNWTLSSVINRIGVKVGVEYGTNPDVVKDILLNVAKENPDVLDDPKALVAFEEFGDSSLNFKLRCCITNIPRRYDILHEINTAIYKKLTEANIGIPFPQRDVNMKYPEGDRA